VGTVEVTGNPGMSVEEFRRHAHLKADAHVDQETGSRALAGVLKVYQGQQRLEAEIKLESPQYIVTSHKDNFRISANRGPVVKVLVEGASASPALLKHVIPIFEEGSVDDDLLNEGNRRLRDFYQRQGYFDVKVEHKLQSTTAEQVTIVYRVRLGARRRVERVSVEGNRYFDSATLKELLSVHVADALDRHGDYSQALVAADISALQAVYQNNGFSKVKITPETSALETARRTRLLSSTISKKAHRCG
jgi:outer membrane protein assembly factor BamA